MLFLQYNNLSVFLVCSPTTFKYGCSVQLISEVKAINYKNYYETLLTTTVPVIHKKDGRANDN